MEEKYPEPTVGALIFNPEGKILLMKSHKREEKSFKNGKKIKKFVWQAD
jgi:nucleoside triphosphatase